MARYTEASCRICRRENTKLFLKGDRCYAEKCAFERRAVPPGQHGARRGKASDYGIQLREKQKVKRSYGLMEKQFRALFVKAERQSGVTGANLLVLLERRLDNIVYRLGFSNSRNQARQMVRHGHFTVNGCKVDIPSFLVKAGDVVGLRAKSQKIQAILDSMETVTRRGVPEWLEMDKANFSGTIRALPTRDALTMPVSEQLIVELYSK